MEPFTTDQLADFDNLWETVAVGYPKLGGVKNVTVRQVITCAIIARAVGNIYGALTKGGMVTQSVAGDNANAAILAMCIQAAVTGQKAAGTVARDAASANSCSTAVVSFPVQISRSGSRYTISANTTVSRAARAPLAVSCQAHGKGLVIKLRTSKRGVKLRSVVGPNFSIGYSNQSKHSVGAHGDLPVQLGASRGSVGWRLQKFRGPAVRSRAPVKGPAPGPHRWRSCSPSGVFGRRARVPRR